MRLLGLVAFMFTLALGCSAASSTTDASSSDAGAGDAAVDRMIYRSHESHYCSSTVEDPMFECSTSLDLVCINTYEMAYPQPNGAPDKVVPLYLCRLACSSATECGTGEVCCPGKIHGPSYGRTRACVPAQYCDAQKADAGSGG